MSQTTPLGNGDEDLVGEFYGEDIRLDAIDHTSNLLCGCREGYNKGLLERAEIKWIRHEGFCH